jgi:hypothetical protein
MVQAWVNNLSQQQVWVLLSAFDRRAARISIVTLLGLLGQLGLLSIIDRTKKHLQVSEVSVHRLWRSAGLWCTLLRNLAVAAFGSNRGLLLLLVCKR